MIPAIYRRRRRINDSGVSNFALAQSGVPAASPIGTGIPVRPLSIYSPSGFASLAGVPYGVGLSLNSGAHGQIYSTPLIDQTQLYYPGQPIVAG